MRVKTFTINLVFYLFTDHLGSNNVVTDPVGGMVSLNLYKPWGESRGLAGTSLTDYSFTGQRKMNDQVGLIYYGARFYDPSLGRWASPDAIITDPYNSLDWDRYSYVRNNSINHNDPSGHCIEDLCVGEIAIASLVVTEVVEHAPEIEAAYQEAAPEVESFVAEAGPEAIQAISEAADSAIPVVEDVGTKAIEESSAAAQNVEQAIQNGLKSIQEDTGTAYNFSFR